jgi:hypothetical protein
VTEPQLDRQSESEGSHERPQQPGRQAPRDTGPEDTSDEDPSAERDRRGPWPRRAASQGESSSATEPITTRNGTIRVNAPAGVLSSSAVPIAPPAAETGP